MDYSAVMAKVEHAVKSASAARTIASNWATLSAELERITAKEDALREKLNGVVKAKEAVERQLQSMSESYGIVKRCDEHDSMAILVKDKNSVSKETAPSTRGSSKRKQLSSSGKEPIKTEKSKMDDSPNRRISSTSSTEGQCAVENDEESS